MHDTSATLPAQQYATELDPLARSFPSRTEIMLEWLAGQPLVLPAIGLITGIFIDAAYAPSFAVAALLFLAAGALLFFARRHDSLRHLAIFLAATAVGAPLHDQSFRHVPRNHVLRFCGESPIPVRITGTILAAPSIRQVRTGRITWYPQPPITKLFLAAESIETKASPESVSGTVMITVHEPLLNAGAGDRVQVMGSIYRPTSRGNPADDDWPLRNRRSGVFVAMSCEHAANVTMIARGHKSSRWLDRIRHRARAAMLDQTYPGEVAGSALLEAMVLGQRSAVNNELNDAFVRTGTVHYVSVSGAHVGMLASVVWMVGLMFGCSRRVCAISALVLLTSYALIAEPNAAIWRAAVMADLLCIAILLRRRLSATNWLALSAIIILVVKPTQLFDAGFQLSFFTLIALMFLSPRIMVAWRAFLNQFWYKNEPLLMPEIQRILNPPSPRRRMFNELAGFCGMSLAVSLAAWSVGACLGDYHFRQIAPWGWLNTFIVAPLMAVVLILGFIKTVLTFVHPMFSVVLAFPLAKITDALINMVYLLDRLPGTHFSPPRASLWVVIAGLAVACFWMAAPWLRIRARWVGLAGFGFITLAAWDLAPARAGDRLRLWTLSVGRATTCLIQLPNGKSLIYDVGSSPPYDLERWTLGPLLAHERIYSLDAVLLSHPDLDHFSGLPDMLDHWPVKCVLTAPHFDQLSNVNRPADRLIEDIEQQGVPRRNLLRGDRLTQTGGVNIEVLWPPPPKDFKIAETNDSSLVLRITYAGHRILLCGDIQEEAQRELLKTADLRADVLVLPHHGSFVSNTGEFIAAVNPQYCIRSSNQRNAETRTDLLALMTNRTYFNTADDGAVTISVTPQKLYVSAMKSP